ncbi:hypothetical protein PQX77_009768, partial [Marasmius sp. AFHP31]
MAADRKPRGRPRQDHSNRHSTSKKSSHVSQGEKPRVGRPPGTGSRQRAAARMEKLRADRGGQAAMNIQTAVRAPKRRRVEDDNTAVKDSENANSVPMTLDSPGFHPTIPTTDSSTSSDNIQLPHAPVDLEHGPHTLYIQSTAPIPADGILPMLDINDESSGVDSVDEAGLAHDGLGEEDEVGDDDDPREENVVIGSTRTNGNPSSRQHPRHASFPLWLRKVFERYVQESSDRRDDGLPPLYRDHQSFYFPRKANFFILRDYSGDDVPSPTSLYDYTFFLWDPECLLPSGIPCPTCSSKLQRNGNATLPRRFVDLNGSVWVIGYRYKCNMCTNTVSGKKTVTFCSWDQRIINVIPRKLALEFPAIFTHRRGISRTLFSFMRTCFQNGMGSKQFANSLQIQHLLNHDKRNLQYLHHVYGEVNTLQQHAETFLTQSQTPKYQPFLQYTARGDNGPAGSTPSSQWMSKVYDKYIEQHQDELNQHTAMLTANVCAIDHSFKLTKQIAKINGYQIFVGLLTVTNEKGEIRLCNLVASKSHSQFEFALLKMRESLEIYGHAQPLVFYTDNMADKGFLEKCFPSLRAGVVPVERYSHLEPLTIPSDVTINLLQTEAEINDAMRSLIQLLPDEEGDSKDGSLVVGFDTEYNVETSSRGFITGRGHTALIQIACGKQIWVMQVAQMLVGGSLPSALKNVLSNPRILKVGRCVAADLKYLEESCSSQGKFTGAIDIGRLAKERLVVKTANTGLSDICVALFGKRVDKNVSERVSDLWESATLTSTQLKYAACDSYASLRCYEGLRAIPCPKPVTPDIDVNTPILVYGGDKSRVIARGRISPFTKESQYDGINIRTTKTRCVVIVDEVYVPAAIMSTHRKRALDSFGSTPFHVVTLWSHLKSSDSLPLAYSPGLPDPIRSSPQSNSRRDSEQPSTSATPPASNMVTITNASMPSVSISTTPVADRAMAAEGAGIGSLILDSIEAPDSILYRHEPKLAATNQYESDSRSVAEGEWVFQQAQAIEFVTLIRSRVLKDAFHVFDLFYIPVNHGLRVDFAWSMRDAVFIPDPQDKARIIAWGKRQSPPQSWESLVFRRARWVWKRCKRYIPPPEDLYERVEKVLRTYGPLKDATTGLPLFNSAAWTVTRNVLELIRKGHLSDPPGIPLYNQYGVDAKTGLPLYFCFRGTNLTEGGVHRHLIPKLPTSGVSVRHVHACLLDFVLCHNLKVGTFNSTGLPYHGHYSIWLTNEIEEMKISLQPFLSEVQPKPGWVNGNLYRCAAEVTGILPIPKDLRQEYSMNDYSTTEHINQLHWFLASRQHTQRPVLPIHNDEEKKLFRKMMASPSTYKNGEPNWKIISKSWNTGAGNDPTISYKLPEHLQLYYNGAWKTNTNIKQTLSQTSHERQPVRDELRDDTSSQIKSLRVPQQPPKLHSVTSGFQPLDREDSSNTTINIDDTPVFADDGTNTPVKEPHPKFSQPRQSIESSLPTTPSPSPTPPTQDPESITPNDIPAEPSPSTLVSAQTTEERAPQDASEAMSNSSGTDLTSRIFQLSSRSAAASASRPVPVKGSKSQKTC